MSGPWPRPPFRVGELIGGESKQTVDILHYVQYLESNMKVVSSLKLRNRLGEIIDAVRYYREPIVVLKNRKPVVRIVPIEGRAKRPGFNLEKYRQLTRRLPSKWQVGDPGQELMSLVGAGDHILREDEETVIGGYLQKKHG